MHSSFMRWDVCRLVHRYRVYKDPFPHPALRGGVVPRLMSCVNRDMAIVQLTHLRISVPASGAPPGQVPADCYPGVLLSRSGRLHVMCHSPRRPQCWGMCLLQCVRRKRVRRRSSCLRLPRRTSSRRGGGVPIGSSSTAPASLPPPSEILAVLLAGRRWKYGIELSCFPFDVDCSSGVLVGQLRVESSLSPITPVCSDVSDSVGSPEVDLLMSHLANVCSDMSADVGRPVSPLPSVGSLFLPNMLLAPVAPPFPVVDNPGDGVEDHQVMSRCS